MSKRTWGYGIAETYAARWELMKGHLDRSRFVLVDWGSDAGWYSLTTAQAFPESSVISVDAGTMLGYESLRVHRRIIGELGIENNFLVNCLFGAKTFKALRDFPSDYQFALNVFHWIGDGYGKPLSSPREWDRAFCDLVGGANVTFFEVPNEEHRRETPHKIREWYDGRDVATVLRDALSRYQLPATVQLLAELSHGHKGHRKLFKITLDSPLEAAPGSEVAANILSASSTVKPTMYLRLRSFGSRLKIKLAGLR